MNFDTNEYLAYKKSKMQLESKIDKTPSRGTFLCQVFFVTFIIIFIIIVVTIMKYSSKMDIEYSKAELQLVESNINNVTTYTITNDDDKQRKIDKRLILIHQEENAPSEARIVNKPKTHMEVIDASHIEKNKKIEKLEKQKKLNQESEQRSSRLNVILEEVNPSKNVAVEKNIIDNNVIVMSKVLIGRYSTFEEAQMVQTQIKAKNPSLQPFVKKIGGVFSIQMGSYQEFSQAKAHAQALRSKGFDVWIYQQ